MTPARLTINSPLGALTISATDAGVTALGWGCDAGTPGEDETPMTLWAARDLAGYFEAARHPITVPLTPQGSPAQRAVCAAMSAIPVGDTRTYGEISNDLSLSPQAVGQLCGGNPIPILIPCHRVLGATSLGGFSGDGGIESKVWLLRHEGAAGLLI